MQDDFQANLDECIEDYFENYFPTYNMVKYRALLLEWLEKDGYVIKRPHHD